MKILDPLERHDAPDASRDVLNSLEGEMGSLPNLYRVLAHSPSALRAYAAMNKLLKDSGLTDEEQQIVLLTASRENRCEYCMAAHSTGARVAGLDEDALESLREGQHIRNDDRLEALRQFTQRMVAKRGRLEDEDIDVFLAAGFDEGNVLDVMLGVAMKTLSNYTNHIAHTPLDERFQDMHWDPSRDMRERGAGRRSSDRPIPARGGRYSH